MFLFSFLRKKKKLHSPQSRYNFGTIESCSVLGEYTLPTQMEEQLATVDVLHYKAQPMKCLK